MNCNHPIETVQHRLAECPRAIETWTQLNRIKDRLNLTRLSDTTMENLVGAKEEVSNLELALQAELILKLSTKHDGYCPEQLVRAAVLLVCNSEKLNPDVRNKFDEFKRER